MVTADGLSLLSAPVPTLTSTPVKLNTGAGLEAGGGAVGVAAGAGAGGGGGGTGFIITFFLATVGLVTWACAAPAMSVTSKRIKCIFFMFYLLSIEQR